MSEPIEAWSSATRTLTSEQARRVAESGFVAVEVHEPPDSWRLTTDSRVGVVAGHGWEVRVIPRLAVPRLMFLLAYAASRDGWRDSIAEFQRDPDLSVAEVFRRYAERLEGSASCTTWLSERGYRTKRGKPFNVPAVLTILRNRAYLGEVYFRGRPGAARAARRSGAVRARRRASARAGRGRLASALESERLPAHRARQVRALRQALRRRRRPRQRRGLRLLRLLLAPALRQEDLRRRAPPRRRA